MVCPNPLQAVRWNGPVARPSTEAVGRSKRSRQTWGVNRERRMPAMMWGGCCLTTRMLPVMDTARSIAFRRAYLCPPASQRLQQHIHVFAMLISWQQHMCMMPSLHQEAGWVILREGKHRPSPERYSEEVDSKVKHSSCSTLGTLIAR